MNAAVDYYAELLANLLGWFSDSAVAGNRVVADGFVLEVDVECTALLVTAVVAGSVAILSPGDRKTKIITAMTIAAVVQVCNLARLIAIAWTGKLLGVSALVWVHDWIAPIWITVMVAMAWNYLSRRGSNAARSDSPAG